jgi:signal transduction histidine kinase
MFRKFLPSHASPLFHQALTQGGGRTNTRSMASRWAGLAGDGLRLAVVAVAYFVTARLGLEFALVHGQVTPVWPPTGIAVVAILLFGSRILPAIALAALAVNLPLGPNPAWAAVIATGNTLAPLAAASLLRATHFRFELDRLRDAASLILLGALVGMSVSATIGSLVLVLSGSVAADAFPQTWAVWWTGDAMGVLLVVPFLLSFRSRRGEQPLPVRRQVELAALLVAVAAVTYLVFQNTLRLEYIVFPLIMVAAFRFRLRGSAPAALIASGVAVWAAVNGSGPFANETLLQKMITLQVFNVFVALVSLVLASYVETRDRAEQARLSNEAKSEFLRDAAHELRGPLTVFGGYLSLLSNGDLGKPPEKWRGPLEILTAKTWELNHIMDELLEVSRLDGHVIAPGREPLDLRDVAAGACERARPRAALAGGEVTLEKPHSPVPVSANPNQLAHLLDNLVNNGLAYSEGSPSIAIRVSIDAGNAAVRVIDHGVGIPDDLKDAIFEPFERGGQHGFEDVPGSGLGLYISRELARAHGGDLLLESSSPGHGSTFVLTLPLGVTEPRLRA